MNTKTRFFNTISLCEELEIGDEYKNSNVYKTKFSGDGISFKVYLTKDVKYFFVSGRSGATKLLKYITKGLNTKEIDNLDFIFNNLEFTKRFVFVINTCISNIFNKKKIFLK